MAPAHDVFADALSLPRAERRRLARELVLSLDGDGDGDGPSPESEVAVAWCNEIDQRVRELLDGEAETLDAREAHADLRTRLATIRTERC